MHIKQIVIRVASLSCAGLVVASCQMVGQGTSRLQDDQLSPLFSCATTSTSNPEQIDLKIEIYETKLAITKQSGDNQGRWVYATVFEIDSPPTVTPKFVCGSETEQIFIRVYDTDVKIKFTDGDMVQTWQYRITNQITEENPVEPPSDTPQDNGTWLSLEREDFSLLYKPGFEADRDVFDRWMTAAVASMRSEFGPVADEVLRGVEVFDIFIHPTPNDSANEGLALLTAFLNRGELDMLAFSAHDPNGRDNVESYLRKTLIHEYATMFLQWIPHYKSGWQDLYSAPGWFVQGYQEYLGLIHADAHSREVTLKRYLSQYLADPDRIRFSDEGIHVQNDYYDGTVLLHFLHQNYGRNAVHSILTSPSRTFDDAFVAAIAPWTEMKRTFDEWTQGLQQQ